MSQAKQFTDQMGRKVKIPFPPKRIVSLVPSQTELLAYFGLEKEVVGITKFCVHPKSWFKEKKRVGGTKKVNLDSVIELDPDLIIGSKEENTENDIRALAERYPVWMSDVQTVGDSLDMISEIGKITACEKKGKELIEEIHQNFDGLIPVRPLRTVYFIWNNPLMTVGSNTFIHEILSRWGLKNVFESEPRYPETSLEQVKEKNPELLLLSSEPFPFKAKHAAYFKKQFPGARIAIVDGELFSWYGSRLLKTPGYLNNLSDTLRIKT